MRCACTTPHSPFTWAPHNILMRKTHTHGIDSIRGGASHICLVAPQGKASNGLEGFCAGEKTLTLWVEKFELFINEFIWV